MNVSPTPNAMGTISNNTYIATSVSPYLQTVGYTENLLTFYRKRNMANFGQLSWDTSSLNRIILPQEIDIHLLDFKPTGRAFGTKPIENSYCTQL